MTVYISAKQVRRKVSQVAACPWQLPHAPRTLRQLLAMLVEDSVAAYNRRLEDKTAQPLTVEQTEDLAALGRIGFGIPYGSREADPEAALAAAIQGFTDGLFRLFIGNQEIENLDAPLTLQEGDTVTILRLVMLTGGFF